jgi:hypothetical protein
MKEEGNRNGNRKSASKRGEKIGERKQEEVLSGKGMRRSLQPGKE